MRFIGITGGVGAGKSAILDYLSKKERVCVMLADEIAHDLMEPGTACYEKIIEAFPKEDILQWDGHFERTKMASVIFANEEKRTKMNAIVHPAVKEYVIARAEEERNSGKLDILVLEAALLIEEHYDEICDELWYIYTKEEIREARLMESRGYSREKVHQIFGSQLGEAVYKKHCSVIIDNNGELEKTYAQIDWALSQLE